MRQTVRRHYKRTRTTQGPRRTYAYRNGKMVEITEEKRGELIEAVPFPHIANGYGHNLFRK